MIIFDAHCDTLTRIMKLGTNLCNSSSNSDIKRMKEYEGFVQVFAAFVAPSYIPSFSLRRALQIIDRLYHEIDKYKDDITLCRQYGDIATSIENGKVAALISIEDGAALQGDISVLRTFYRLGVRSICLTWNHRNEIADGVEDSSTRGGLTPFGREVVREMNRLGMLADLSHISDTGFWDVVECSESPIIASHSNAREICSHKRNLSNEQLLAIKAKDGVVGINLYPHFLNDSGTASLKDITKHIEHMAALIGCGHIGIGSDFDGIELTPEDICGVEDIGLIFEQLLKLNYSQKDVEAIAGGNFLRVFRTVCG